MYNNGDKLYNQMSLDLLKHISSDTDFQNASKKLEKKVKKYINGFILERYN